MEEAFNPEIHKKYYKSYRVEMDIVFSLILATLRGIPIFIGINPLKYYIHL
jgi:hypothetical protein